MVIRGTVLFPHSRSILINYGSICPKYRGPCADMFQLETDESGRRFARGSGMRKTAVASVCVFEGGSGEVKINGRRIFDFFNMIADRLFLIFISQSPKNFYD